MALLGADSADAKDARAWVLPDRIYLPLLRSTDERRAPRLPLTISCATCLVFELDADAAWQLRGSIAAIPYNNADDLDALDV